MINFRKLSLMLSVLAIVLSASVSTVLADAGSQYQILQAVNSIRQQYRLPLLRIHPSLQKAADEQARLMARTGKMAHKVGRGHGFSARLRRVGYRGLAAENIARGQESLGRVLRAWLKSPGHRRNMLHPRMRFFGLAANRKGSRNYWAMVLGG